MTTFTTVVRFPFALAVSCVIIFISSGYFLLETFLILPYMALAKSRQKIAQYSYPQSLKSMRDMLSDVWQWVFSRG